VFVRYLQSGLPNREAKGRAISEVKGYLGTGAITTVRTLSAGSTPSAQPESAQQISTKEKVRAYLASNPDAAQDSSINEVVSALGVQGVRAGRTTVAEVLREFKKQPTTVQ